jgi:prepilin-type N-terminal cleavage/methylation domain-containing protein
MKKGFTIIELMIVVAIIGILAAVTVDQVDSFSYKKKLVAKGYDVTEVTVFLKNSGFTYRDLYNSSALQKQYDTFRAGGDQSFMNNARVAHAASEAQSTANTAVVLSLMNTSNSGR